MLNRSLGCATAACENTGRRIAKHAPAPSLLSHVISPPILVTKSFATAKPYPVAGSPPVGCEAKRAPLWNSFFWSESLIPGPSCRTLQNTAVLSEATSTRTAFPGGEYLTALESRLSIAAASATASTQTLGVASAL